MANLGLNYVLTSTSKTYDIQIYAEVMKHLSNPTDFVKAGWRPPAELVETIDNWHPAKEYLKL